MAENKTVDTAKRQKTLAQELATGSTGKRIPLYQKIAYGFGDFGNGFMFDLG